MFKKKVFLAIACMAIMTLVLVGCSGKKESPTPSQASQSVPVAEQSTTTSSPTVTVASYLAQFGLTEDDIKPDGFVSSELNGIEVKFLGSNVPFVPEWYKKVFDTTKGISEDGKCYNDMYPFLEDEYELDASKAEAMAFITSYSYKYNGKVVKIMISGGNGEYSVQLWY